MDQPTNSAQPKENHNLSTLYYGVYIPNEAKDYTVAPNVFEDKLEALKVAKKNKKSRFKAFHFYHEAAEFAVNGSEFPNNSNAAGGIFFNKEPEPTQTIGEKASPFKGPKPQELVELRKAIENGHYKIVRDTIWQNPRYLVSSGDTPSILQEGPRYNALHVSAKSRNAQITELILTTVSNVDFIKLLYGDDNQQNAEDRTAVLLDLYLNTPNKGLNETPLHFASKHGAAEVVEILVSYPQCDKTLRNKFNKTAEEIICERAESYNLPEIRKKIQMLLRDSYYVPVLRAEDKSMAPMIGEPFSPTRPLVFNKDPLSPIFEIHAYAGPMDHKGAQEFRKMWKTPPRSLSFNSPKKLSKDIVNVSSLRFKDPDKGLERIGNKLAHKYDVNWKEYWPFLGSFLDISSEEGLSMLENHFTNRYASVYDSVGAIEEMKKDSPEINKSDILSPISNLCQAFSTFHINDSSRSINSSPEKKTDIDSVTYIDCACQVFANRISNDILHVLYSEENILQVLEIEIKQLELLITSYMEDDRFLCINFQKIHSRLGLLVGQKLYNNIKEEVRVYLCSKIENDLDTIMKSVDCFSSDDESHLKETSEVRKPTIYKKQLICLIHFILNILSQNYDSKQTGNDEDCAKVWENAEACSCIYHMRKSKRNSLSRSSSFKNSKLLQKNEVDGVSKRLTYDEPHGDNDVMNGLNSSLNLSHIVFSSDEDSDDESEETFYTPPSSPSLLIDDSESEDEFNDTELPKLDVYIESEYPTKLDLEVFNAINYADVTIDRTKYPNVYKWYHSISLYDREERESWQCLKDRNTTENVYSLSTSLCNNNSFSMDSPKTSTPSKSWLRITGANSPKTVFKSNSIRM